MKPSAERRISASFGSGSGAAPAGYSLCILSSSGNLYSRGSTKLTWCPRAESCAFKNRAYLVPCRSERTDPYHSKMQTHDLPSHAQPLPRLLVTLDTAVLAFGADHQHEIGGASRYAPAIVKWWSRWPKSPRRKTREFPGSLGKVATSICSSVRACAPRVLSGMWWKMP